jgi:hypothetical protein
MTLWLVWRHLVLILRHQGFVIATTLHLAAVAYFVVIWGDGVPVWRDDPVLVQLSRLEVGLLAVILPWVAIRCSPDESHNALVQLATATARRPLPVVVARTVGTACALLTLTSSALPMFVFAQQLSALPVWMVIPSLVPVAALAVLVAVLAAAASVFLGSRLLSWLVTTMATVSAASISMRGATGMLAVAAVIVLFVLMSADRRLRYLSEAGQF